MIKGKNIGAFHTRSTARSDTLAYAWRSQKRGKIHHPGRSPVESSDRREGGSADSSEAASHAGSVAAVSAGGKGGEWNGVPADKWHFTMKQLEDWFDGVPRTLVPNIDFPAQIPPKRIQDRLRKAASRRGGSIRVWMNRWDGSVSFVMMPWFGKEEAVPTPP